MQTRGTSCEFLGWKCQWPVPKPCHHHSTLNPKPSTWAAGACLGSQQGCTDPAFHEYSPPAAPLNIPSVVLRPSGLILGCWWLAGNWIWGCIGGPGCPIWSQSGTNLGHNCVQDASKKQKMPKNTQITELYKNTMLQDLFVGQKGPKSGSALGHPFGLEAKLWRVPGHP